jgi:hypothetical protein
MDERSERQRLSLTNLDITHSILFAGNHRKSRIPHKFRSIV